MRDLGHQAVDDEQKVYPHRSTEKAPLPKTYCLAVTHDFGHVNVADEHQGHVKVGCNVCHHGILESEVGHLQHKGTERDIVQVRRTM
eukprot:1143671-Pelagomonas_calceolata.AAC.2